MFENYRDGTKPVALAVNPGHQAVEFAWPDGARDRLEAYAAASRRVG